MDFHTTDKEIKEILNDCNDIEVPEKYKNCDWLYNYGHIGLTKEHIKRLNNTINILKSLNEHTDAKYLKEIKEKLLEDFKYYMKGE